MTTEIKQFSVIDKGIGAMTKKYKTVPDCATKEGHEDCKKQHREMRKFYTRLEKKRKVLTLPLREKVTKINKAAADIVERLDVISHPFKLAVDTRNDEIEAEEAKRISGLKKEISDIQGFIIEAAGKDSQELAAIIQAVDNIYVDEHFQEFQAEARESLLVTKTKIAEMLSQAIQKEITDKAAADAKKDADAAKKENDELKAKIAAMEVEAVKNTVVVNTGDTEILTVTQNDVKEDSKTLKEVITSWDDCWSIDKIAIAELYSELTERGFI